MRARPNNATGFSLLEAIVALTLLAMAAAALYGWLSVSIGGLRRAEAAHLETRDSRSALAIARTLNPSRQPSGRIEIGDLAIEWESIEVVPQKVGRTPTGMPSAFDVALFDVTLRTFRSTSETSVQTVRKAGWVVTRPFDADPQN